ncbi:unnamed protein product [Blepharisma stoltei]|uniref:PPM-type phosphatase domain-containing protein n=1 Tax=Blepharisma stoltei TaxID=1481888 RepID=A0AAU9IU79_9CILI|nr:unnamed protein product [Blepharisma stoltei]
MLSSSQNSVLPLKDKTNAKETISNFKWKSIGSSLEPLSMDSLKSPRIPSVQTSRSHKPVASSSTRTTPRNIRCQTARNSERKSIEMPFTINPDLTKCSLKENGIVKAYAACTNQGLVRNYNEDRVSIILNIMKPPNRANENWPRCSFFGVYDGHGGSACADFLRDNLHQFVIRDPNFPFNPKEAIKAGFQAAERTFLEFAKSQTPIDRSGSCAIVIVIVGEICYAANVGDSRAIMSGEKGSKIYPLSKDHKPYEEKEYERIISKGGRVYQSTVQGQENQQIAGPYRVFPGRLSVSRTFGDIEGKHEDLGGNSEVLISSPEIKAFKVHAGYDFIVLASDGIFDKLTNKEVIQCVWSSVYEGKAQNCHRQCGNAVENVMKTALIRRTLDNITVVMIALESFITQVEGIYSRDS